MDNNQLQLLKSWVFLLTKYSEFFFKLRSQLVYRQIFHDISEKKKSKTFLSGHIQLQLSKSGVFGKNTKYTANFLKLQS